MLGRPKIDEIQVKFLWDTNVVLANVLSGAVELTMGSGLSVDQVVARIVELVEAARR